MRQGRIGYETPGRLRLNSVYITFGVAVVLVLITALVGPFFVDWTVYRSTFETYASRVLGHRVTVLGEADLRLLPAPYVRFSDVRVGEAEDPLLVVSQFDMRVELPPLLKGEFKVIEMDLDRPHLTLSLDEDGRLDWLTAVTADSALAELPPDDVALENVTIRNGSLSIIDARSGETHTVDDGNLSVSARTLAGPFRADGSLTLNGNAYTAGFATGRFRDGEGLRLKGDVTPVNLPVNFGFDGQLSEIDAAPRFEGVFQIASIALDENDPNVWTAEGEFAADIAEVAIPEFEFRFGPEDRLLSMSGSADLVYSGDKRFEVRALSKQVDLDRLMGGGPQAPVTADAAGERLLSALAAVPLPAIDGVVSMDVPAVVASGGIIQNVSLDLETMLGGWRLARLAGRLPGRTDFTTSGDLVLAPELTYRGDVTISSEQPGSLANWWGQSDGGASIMDPVSLRGRLNVQPDGAALDDLSITLAGSEASGGFAYLRPRTGPSEVSLTLDADKLDLDQIQALATLVRQPIGLGQDAGADGQGSNIAVRLRAKEVVAGDIQGEGLALEAEYSDGGIRIDRLFAADLAGARVDVGGQIENLASAPQGSLSGSLDARDLTGLVALVNGFFPDTPAAARLEKAAPNLVPARFDAQLNAAAIGAGTDLSIELSGTAGGSETGLTLGLKGRVDTWQDSELSIDVAMSGSDGSKLLQQIGLDVIPVDTIGASRFALAGTGIPADGMPFTLTSNLGNTEIIATGNVTLQKEAEPDYGFHLELVSPDLTPLALMYGRVLPVMTGALPAELTARIEGIGTQLAIGDIAGVLAGTQVTGQLEGDLEPVPGERNRRFSGVFNTSHLDLKALTETVLGPDQWFSMGDGSSIWPVAFFGGPLLEDFDLTVDLRTDSLVLEEDTAIRAARAEMRLTPTLLRLDGVNGAFAGGTLEGSLSLRRSEAEGAASGRIKLTGADVRQVAWRPDGRSVASGTLDLYLEFEGAGRSISAIVAGLNGGGTFVMTNGDVRRLNPEAFPLVTRAVDAGLDLQEERIAEVFVSHMAAGSLPFERVDGTLTLVGGQLSARNVVVDSATADVFGSAELDLNTYDLDADFSVKVDPGVDAVTGAEPQIGLLFSGPVEAPERRIDVAPFTAYLTLRAFEKEVERVERLQAEILERDRLSRELKRQGQAAERRIRLAAEAAARAAAEEEQRRLQEEATPDAPAGEQSEQENTLLPKAGEQPDKQIDQASGSDSELTDRIRAVLDASRTGALELSSEAVVPGTRPLPELPPLEGPVNIEDLLSGQFGTPAAQ